MNQLDFLRTLARYNAWANAEVIAAVRALPAGEATRERPSLFPTIVRTFNHPLVTDRMWWAHLHGQPNPHKALNEVLHQDFEALTAARSEMDGRIIGYAEALTEKTADEAVDFTLVSGVPGTLTRAMILMHMINHSTYHRGFLVDLFCQIPAPMPTTDLPVFMRGASGLMGLPPHLKPVTWAPVATAAE
ncbi:MAG: damage-inducible protein DinB [Alphaproteobacteria bacterium]|nr:damage-inducible protein DinB [Alphaproteobacteria bacterium]